MPDIATLGLKIDSSQASTAAKELDKLTAAGKKAEQQSALLGASFKTSGVQAADLLKNTNLSTAARERLAAQLAKQGVATDAVTKASQGLAKGQTTATQGALGLLSASGALTQEHNKGNDAATRFVDTLTKRFILGFAIAQVRGLAAGIAGMVSEMAKLGDLGKLTGIGSGNVQGLVSAAGNKGIDTATMSAAMVAFNQQIPLARAGVGALGELLRANRVTVTDTGDAFFKLSDLIKNARDDTARMSMLQQAGLPATMEMVRFMSQGSAALKQQVSDSSKLTDAQIESAQKVRDAWNTTWQRFKDAATLAIADAIDKMGELERAGAKAVNNSSFANSPLWGLISGSKFEAAKNLLKVGGGTQLNSGIDVDRFYAATGAGGGAAASGTATGTSRDYATEKAIAQDRISKAQQYLGLLGSTTTALEARRAVELQIQAAGLNGVGIDRARAETLKQLAEEQVLGITAIKSSTDAQRVEAETVGMSVGQATAYTAAQNALNDAKRNGRALTDADTDAIRRNAAALGEAAQHADNMKWSYENLVRGPMQEFRSQIARGATAMEALRAAGVNALNAISTKLMDMAAQGLWESAFGGKTGGGGLFGLLGGLFGSGSSGGVLPGGLPLGLGGIGHAHGGAIVGSEATFNRYVHPAYFDDAPRFHSGGMIGMDEVPIVAKKGEGVFTPAQMKALAPAAQAGTSVVINQTNNFTNADPGSEARMRAWSKQTKDAAVNEAVQAVATVKRNTPSYLAGGR